MRRTRECKTKLEPLGPRGHHLTQLPLEMTLPSLKVPVRSEGTCQLGPWLGVRRFPVLRIVYYFVQLLFLWPRFLLFCCFILSFALFFLLFYSFFRFILSAVLFFMLLCCPHSFFHVSSSLLTRLNHRSLKQCALLASSSLLSRLKHRSLKQCALLASSSLQSPLNHRSLKH